jgi:acyl-coenzyme A synthetase/AMP-(fatty) acid ligase
MARTLPLLSGYAAEGVLAWRGGEPLYASRFAAAAVALANRLPQRRHVLNLCEERYAFMLGYAASLLAGQTTLLPPSRAVLAVREVCRDFPDIYCLSDRGAIATELPTVEMRAEVLDAPGNAQTEPGKLEVDAEQIAAIVFTSGSTGRHMPHPKNLGSLVAGARTLGAQLALAPGTTIVGTLPPQHMFGLESTVMLPMQNGLAVHAGRPLLPADLRAAIAALPRPLWLMTSPLHLRACVAEPVALQGVSGVLSSTMPLAPELARAVERLWKAPLYEIYGSSEAGMIAMRRTAQDETWRLVPGLRFSERDGTLWVQGNHVREPQPVLDRVTQLDAERFTLQGRKADVVKIAGKRTSLEALNAALLAVQGVKDGVFFVPDAPAGGRLIAFAVAPGVSAKEIRAALRQRIDAAFLPRPLHLVAELPRGDSGKIARRALAELAAALGRDIAVED